MPKHAPFTRLCGQLAALARPRRADLHAHTTASDGDYTPAQVVALARQAGLCAVAITDHDTLAGVPESLAQATEAVEVIPGVEVSTSFAGREFHLLGYFVRTDHGGLNAALAGVRESRRERFRELVALLRERGLNLPDDRVRLAEEATHSLGRRHAASLLLACGHAKTRTEAFHRFVNPLVGRVRAKSLVPLAEAIQLVHAAGGVASLAHPSPELTDDSFAELRALGLDAVEVAYPWGRSSPAARLRETAARFGFVVSGGSDCHGPDPAHRRVGSHSITSDELAALRERAAG
jgi:predicted metal-dependent phosphoesterase TrpH